MPVVLRYLVANDAAFSPANFHSAEIQAADNYPGLLIPVGYRTRGSIGYAAFRSSKPSSSIRFTEGPRNARGCPRGAASDSSSRNVFCNVQTCKADLGKPLDPRSGGKPAQVTLRRVHQGIWGMINVGVMRNAQMVHASWQSPAPARSLEVFTRQL